MRLCDQILYRLLEMLEMINMHDIGAIICVCVVVRTTAERCRVKEIMFFIYRLRQPVQLPRSTYNRVGKRSLVSRRTV